MVVAWTEGGAQSPAGQQRIVDSLAAHWEMAARRIALFDDSVKAVRLANDTVLAPPLRILAEPGLGELARSAGGIGADTVMAVAGAAAGRLEDVFLVLRRDETQARRAQPIVVRVLESSGKEGISGRVAADSIELANMMAELALAALSATLNEDFRAWVHQPVRWDSMPTGAWASSRMNLISMETDAARRCFQRDLAACRSVLGLTFESEDDWHAGLRGALTRVALQMGGPRAYERLLTAGGSPPEQLAFTANAPLDSVISQWHARVRYARLPSQDMSSEIATMSLFWILVCGALSLRSTRWR